MLSELNMLDHTILDEEKKSMLMLIFDVENIWSVDSPRGWGKLTYSKKQNEKNLEHLLCLKKKVENYISYIQSNGITKSFPNCKETNSYSYEIRVVTNFTPAPDYFDLIAQMNKVLAKQGMNIVVTHETNK